jgi:S-DNA-T family DNA segregation ATPase FtsK/SpoIIIE
MKFKEYWEKYKVVADKQRMINEFANNFNDIMTEAGKYTASYKTYKLQMIEYREYGFMCQIYCPLGLTFLQLEEAIELIQDGIGCRFIIKRTKGQKFLFADVIMKDIVSKIKYNAEDLYVLDKKEITKDEYEELIKDTENQTITFEVEEDKYYKIVKRKKVKPYEFFLGYDASGKPIIVNMVHYAHIMITGSTRSGKSKLLDCILTSLIYHNTPLELELYLFQIAKNDLLLYRKYKQVRGYAKTLDEAIELLEHVKKEMDRRADLIAPMHERGLGNNILEYNKRYPERPLTFVHVVFDEMSSLIDIEGEDDDIKKKKKKIIKYVSEITQYGGSLGINGVFSLQRATHDKLPPFAKANCNLIVSFKQNNQKSSEVAIGDPSLALGLQQREIVYRTTDYDFSKVPLIEDRLIIKTLQKWEDYNHPIYKYGNKEEKQDKGKGGKKEKNKNAKEEKREIEVMDAFVKTMEMMTKVQEQKLNPSLQNGESCAKPDIKLPDTSPVYDKVAPQTTTDIKKIMEESIKKIGEGYVPWTPPNPNRIIHDQTTFDPSKTEKPRKQNKE